MKSSIFPFFPRGSTVSANKALELVRAALQPSLNAEIEAMLKSYQEVIMFPSPSLHIAQFRS